MTSTPQLRSAGVVGIGNMGGGMAARLLSLGWTVRVRDLDASREQALQALGAQVAATPAEAAQGVAALIVCVVDAPQVEQVLFGADGAAKALRPGQAVLLCPTLAPADVEGFAQRLQALGVQVVDAPMSGGPQRARDGSMSLMVACADTAWAACEALVHDLSGQVFRVGSRPGDGARTKLVNNLLAGINLVGAAEAMALARRLGLDGARTLDVIERSSGQSWVGSDRMRRALAGDYAPRAHMTLLRKDTRLAVEMAQAAGFEGPLGAAARDAFAQAAQAGFADLDDAALLRWLES